MTCFFEFFEFSGFFVSLLSSFPSFYLLFLFSLLLKYSSLYLSGQQDDHGLAFVVGDVRGSGAEVRDEVGIAWRRRGVFFFEVDERGKSERR